MRPATNRGARVLATIGLFVLVVSYARMGAAAPSPLSADAWQCVATAKAAATTPVAPQFQHDPRTNAGFAFSLTSDGGVRMMMKAGDLGVEKIVYRDGRSHVTLQAGDDLVTIVAVHGTIDVERHNQSARRLELPRATDDDWIQVKILLAGSKAVRLFRTVAYNLGAETLQTPAGAAVLTSDAVLGVLDGDVAAIRRLAQQFHGARQAGIRPVMLRQEFLGCYRKYTDAVNAAYDEYNLCTISYYPWDPRQYLCSFEWTLKVESAWFQFIACSAFPWMD